MIKYEKKSDDLNLPIKLIRFEEKQEQSILKHWHNSLEIVLPVRGGDCVWIDGQYLSLNTTPVIINSRSIHAFEIGRIEPYVGLALQINYQFLKEIYSKIDYVTFKQPDEEIGTLIKKQILLIDQYYKLQKPNKELLIYSALYHLIYLLDEYLSVEKKDQLEPKSEKNKQRITSIVNYIDNNYQEDLTIEHLSEVFQLSKGYISKLFKDNLDITIKTYISQVRAKQVKQALLTSDLPLIDLSMMYGFPNVKSMTKVFKELYHCTPHQYRQKYR